MAGEFFRMRNIVKSYRMGGEEQVVLKGIDLDIQPGEFLSILGPSGSGKTTLMNLIGCLDTPTSGEYILDGQLIRALSEKELARIRLSLIHISHGEAPVHRDVPLPFDGLDGVEQFFETARLEFGGHQQNAVRRAQPEVGGKGQG